MKVVSGISVNVQPEQAVNEACTKITANNPKLIIFFSDRLSFESYTQLLHKKFPETPLMGVCTYSSMSNAGYLHKGLQLVAFLDGVTVKTGAIHEISTNPQKYDRPLREYAAELGEQPDEQRKTVCVLFNTAGLGAEELVLDTLQNAFADFNIPVFGGSASSDIVAHGYVSLNGLVLEESSIYALITFEDDIFMRYQENMFKAEDKCFRVTRSDLESRTIYELDGHPVSDVLCRALKVSKEELPEALKVHPLGRVSNNNLFISEITQVNDDGSITTYCRTFNQTEVVLLDLGDFREEMRTTIDDINEFFSEVEFSLLVNCFSRVKLYENRGWMDEFSSTFSRDLGQYIGLASHGEQLDGYLLNLTLLVLAVGKPR